MRHCKHCGDPLVLSENWMAGNQKKSVYRCNACYNKWRREHPGNFGASRGIHRKLRLLGQSCNAHPECANITKEGVLARSDGTCGICGYRLRRGWHMDHIFPVVRGGLHCYQNLQPAHKGCNLAKSDMTMEEYLAQ